MTQDKKTDDERDAFDTTAGNPEMDGQAVMPSLQGQLLLASPHIGDERFEKSVILMCHHDSSSAMGMIINKRTSSLNLGDLYEKLDIGAPRFCAGNPVHIGGPVDSNRGFVLH